MNREMVQRFFPAPPRKTLKEIDAKTFRKVRGKCYHKKGDLAPDLETLKLESAKCLVAFGNCWRTVAPAVDE